MVAIKTGASIYATGRIEDDSHVVSFPLSVSFLTVMNNDQTSGSILYVMLNGALDGSAGRAPSNYDYKLDFRESIRLMNEDIDVLSLGVHLTKAGATYNLSQAGSSIGNFYVPIRGW